MHIYMPKGALKRYSNQEHHNLYIKHITLLDMFRDLIDRFLRSVYCLEFHRLETY